MPTHTKQSDTEVAATTTNVEIITLDSVIAQVVSLNDVITATNQYAVTTVANIQTEIDALTAQIAQFRALGVQTQSEIDAANPAPVAPIIDTPITSDVTPTN